ncbi:uncharacterized protein EDB93DRAFT_1099647 [Suillus bovinus]|uniref:uncharacterized protein n=1 Tax=Suillus bovinus TaxID=48563 RepID=UPI001B878F2D|nr:uncharacterized protein EDB93DRAFT_1099647 [Suillus bovinus]KAG2159249.1 hypothetical protein EDB93DRAFT_1099647 [Suillus bovinus]
MDPYAGNYLASLDATSNCLYCPIQTTDQYMYTGFNIEYSHHWHDVGMTVFNVAAIFTLTHGIARVYATSQRCGTGHIIPVSMVYGYVHRVRTDSTFLNVPTIHSIIVVNKSTANDMASLAESTPTRSETSNISSSSLQSIADNVAKSVRFILPQVEATPSELHYAAPKVIDVDDNDAAPASEQDDEADLNALKKTRCSAVYWKMRRRER